MKDNSNSKRESFFQKVVELIDIFSFLPVPKANKISTKRSKMGSVILFTLFILYVTLNLI
jgi:hypothetical protein